MGLNEVMKAATSGVTYYIYVKDGIRPRLRLLIDTIWLSVVGVATLLALGATATYKCSSLRFISSGLGLVTFVTAGSSRPKLERKSFVDACVEGYRWYWLRLFLVTLQKSMMRWNLRRRNSLRNLRPFQRKMPNQTFRNVYSRHKRRIWSHRACRLLVIRDALFRWELRYEFRASVWNDGDGVLFSADREKYIEFCKRENHKTLLGYGLALSPEQLAAVDKKSPN